MHSINSTIIIVSLYLFIRCQSHVIHFRTSMRILNEGGRVECSRGRSLGNIVGENVCIKVRPTMLLEASRRLDGRRDIPFACGHPDCAPTGWLLCLFLLFHHSKSFSVTCKTCSVPFSRQPQQQYRSYPPVPVYHLSTQQTAAAYVSWKRRRPLPSGILSTFPSPQVVRCFECFGGVQGTAPSLPINAFFSCLVLSALTWVNEYKEKGRDG